MNICFCSQEYPPETHVGGIGTYTYNMSSALASMGHNVHVITSTRKQKQEYVENGVNVHRIYQRQYKLHEFSIFVHSIAVAKEISRINCNFDIVQASEYGSEAFWLSVNKRYPLITRLATPFFLIERLNGKAFLGPRPFFNLMEKRQTLNSNGIFSSTKALAGEVAKEWKIPSSNIKVIPNSVDIERIVMLGEKGHIPQSLKGTQYLLYFGRLEERKGVHTLADALPSVLKQYNNLHAVFAGNDLGYEGGSMRSYITQKTANYANRVHFFENLPHSELFPIVKNAKMVVLPSLWEAFGFVLVEALALGRPVIATSGSGFEEIIKDGESGFLVEPGKSSKLCRLMIEVLQSDDRLENIGMFAREHAKTYEVSNVAKQLITYYQSIINKLN